MFCIPEICPYCEARKRIVHLPKSLVHERDDVPKGERSFIVMVGRMECPQCGFALTLHIPLPLDMNWKGFPEWLKAKG